MSDFQSYVDKHIALPPEGTSTAGAREHLEGEFRRLMLEACRIHCDVAEAELAASGEAARFAAEAPRLLAALLLTSCYHQALGRDFQAPAGLHRKSSSAELRKRYEGLGKDGLELLVRCLREGRKVLVGSRNPWAALCVPFIDERMPVSALATLEEKIDVAAEIVESFIPGGSSTALGAIKIRYFLPDDLWNGPEMSEERFVLGHIYRWDSYVPTDSVVRSVYLHQMQEIPEEVVEGLGLAALAEPFPPPLRGEVLGRLAAQIALLPETEHQDFGAALKEARWALVFPSGHCRVEG